MLPLFGMSTPVKTGPLLFFPNCCRPVFIASAVLILSFIVFGSFFTPQAKQLFQFLQESINHYFSWYYILTVTILLVFAVWLLFSRYGDIRLGDPGEEPRFTYLGWFSMLFSAGMGIGLLFWSAAEPIQHYSEPPFGTGSTVEAAKNSIYYTYFHWGLHTWGIYAVVGLSLAYFSFRHKLPLAIRSTLYPLIGDRIYGPIGHVVDTFAVFGTMFGVCTSLGLGAIQISAGVNYLFGIQAGTPVQILIIAAITAAATTSVVLGLSKGIKRLSTFNVTVSAIFMVVVLIIGPTVFILDTLVESTGNYLQQIIYMSFWTGMLNGSEWVNQWTMFYWGWWLAWSPFVGMFIARVSRGRTIREFIMGVLFAPTLVIFIWIAIIGGTAIDIELNIGGLTSAVSKGPEWVLYMTLDKLPMATLLAAVATLIIITFFVTSSDSGSLVIDMLTAGGEPNPPKSQRVFWAILEGVVAAVLLISGGLKALQSAALTSSLPFSLVILVMLWALVRALRTETGASPREEPPGPSIDRNKYSEQDYEIY